MSDVNESSANAINRETLLREFVYSGADRYFEDIGPDADKDAFIRWADEYLSAAARYHKIFVSHRTRKVSRLLESAALLAEDLDTLLQLMQSSISGHSAIRGSEEVFNSKVADAVKTNGLQLREINELLLELRAPRTTLET